MPVRAQAPAVQPVQGDDYEEEFEGEDPRGGGEDGGEGAGEGDPSDDASGQDASEGEGEGLDDDLAGFFPPQQQQPRRAQSRIQRLLSENAELRRQAAARPVAPAAPSPAVQPNVAVPEIETDAAFNARLALLNPEDRVEARLERSEKLAVHRENVREAQRLQREQAQTFQADRTAFEAKALGDQRYARWKDRVEAKHIELLGQGQFVPREVVFKFLLGEHLLSQAGQRETQRQAKRGQERVARQTTRPANNGSDVGGGRRQQTEAQARARRLENVQL